MNCDVEVANGKKYVAYFTDYKGDNWDRDVLRLFSQHATYGKKLFSKIELRQGAKDKTGFYPNYLFIITENGECQYEVDKMLDAYEFGFKQTDIKIKKLMVDCESGVEYIVEEW